METFTKGKTYKSYSTIYEALLDSTIHNSANSIMSSLNTVCIKTLPNKTIDVEPYVHCIDFTN